ncbi:hypothetical protein B0H17DRAFT_963424, partial [Mycena rosella]
MAEVSVSGKSTDHVKGSSLHSTNSRRPTASIPQRKLSVCRLSTWLHTDARSKPKQFARKVRAHKIEILEAQYIPRLHTTLESLRPPKPADKKTAFWTAYKTLADEFDKEFQRKYGNDLDTMLIFAGLFSAVSSAFIIEIQPEFQPNPNSMTETLLLALVQNITGGTPPGIEMPGPTGPGALVVVAQSLLYFSLLSTLLAALLAVLGKQW